MVPPKFRLLAILALLLLVGVHVLRLVAAACQGAACDGLIPLSALMPLLALIAVGVTGFTATQVARSARRPGWAAYLAAATITGVLGPLAALAVLRDHPDLLVATATGLAPSTRVLCGVHDSNASLVPHLRARDKPFTLVSTGTWAIVMAVGGAGTLDERADMLANVDVTGAPIASARFMAGREFVALAGDSPPRVGEADVAALVASGAMASPSFSDQGGPFAGRRGEILGAPPAGARARAALATLYVALMTDLLIDRLGAAGPVVIEGGFARDGAFAACLAALAPARTVEVAGDAAGAAEGAADLARWGEPARPRPLAPAPAWRVPGLDAYRARWRAASWDDLSSR